MIRSGLHADIVIAGGGPVGASLALALKGSGLDVLLIEARKANADDRRPLALSHGTALALARLGAGVESLAATPIDTVHVSQRGGFGRTRLCADELGIPALGYVVAYATLARALEAALPANGTRTLYGASVSDARATGGYVAIELKDHGDVIGPATARLLVLADGGKVADAIGIRASERDYRQSAVTAIVSTEPCANGAAHERFTASGPIALLPFADSTYALIWTTSPGEASELVALDEAAFIARLESRFGRQSLRFTGVGTRAVFPLRLRYAAAVTAPRVALIGNAAQSLHPVAGQGLNVGMRDVQVLASLLRAGGREQVGEPDMLARYAAMRRWDARGGIAVTDLLARGFLSEFSPLQDGRGAALAALDLLPPLRKWFARKMMFGISG